MGAEICEQDYQWSLARQILAPGWEGIKRAVDSPVKYSFLLDSDQWDI